MHCMEAELDSLFVMLLPGKQTSDQPSAEGLCGGDVWMLKREYWDVFLCYFCFHSVACQPGVILRKVIESHTQNISKTNCSLKWKL